MLKIRRSFRHSLAREVAGGGTNHAAALSELAGDEPAVRQIAHADGDVGLLRHLLSKVTLGIEHG
ncbi:hypothetical protein ATY29_09405 [Rhizobium hidalgonense]|nr:hypothetical protein ATY29_09405 [Rhizobium hidalgonense]